MPLGDLPAGDGPLGFDPVQPASPPRRTRPPVSLMFDGATRDFPLGEDGFYREIHPVDQRVALALLVSEGVIASAPEIGSRLRTIDRVSREVARSTATSYARLALSALVAERSIRIEKIEVETPAGGTLLVAVTYVNLQARGSGARIARAPLAFT